MLVIYIGQILKGKTWHKYKHNHETNLLQKVMVEEGGSAKLSIENLPNFQVSTAL